MSWNSSTTSSDGWNEGSSALSSSCESTGSDTSICFPTIDEIKTLRFESDLIGDHFEILENIGEGSFGTVFKAKRKFDTQHYALKIIPWIKEEDNEAVCREVESLSQLDHENIIRYYASSPLTDKDDPFGTCNKYICIQMQLCRKTLRTFIENFSINQTWETENQRYRNIKEIFEGLQYLHDNGIMHRDLNPNNIFLSNNGVIKIGDFGQARRAPVACIEKTDSKCMEKSLTCYLGTRIYCAPELPTGNYDKKVDFYSLGVIIFEMFHLFQPGTTEQEKSPIIEGIRSKVVKLPDSFPKGLEEVVRGLLQHSPDDRMDLDIAKQKVQQFVNENSSQETEIESVSSKVAAVAINAEKFGSQNFGIPTESGERMLTYPTPIMETNIQDSTDQHFVGPNGDNRVNERSRARDVTEENRVWEDKYEKDKEKIRVAKEAIVVFTGNQPYDQQHIVDVVAVLENFPHPNSSQEVKDMSEYARKQKGVTADVEEYGYEELKDFKQSEDRGEIALERSDGILTDEATGSTVIPDPGDKEDF